MRWTSFLIRMEHFVSVGILESFPLRVAAAINAISAISPSRLEGRVVAVSGLAVEISGIAGHLSIGNRVAIQPREGVPLLAEVVGFRNGIANAMTFGTTDGLGDGDRVVSAMEKLSARLAVSDAWIGRVLDPFGNPLDGRGQVNRGAILRPLRAPPPEAARRARLGSRIDLGIGALNAFATCRAGQRLGLFAGSGVGKSTLLSMLARFTKCDVAVLALVGERGREVREFLEDDLGEAGLERTTAIIATSDASPLMRREAAYASMVVAEHFRDEGKNVLLLMDSVSRFCHALREIGLAAGEPPATRGYPPSVFA